MKKLAMFAACAAMAAPSVASGTALFGPDGLVEDRSAALAELVPWKAPAANLELAEEKVEYLGDGEYSVTRTVANRGPGPVAFQDELRVRDVFAADRYLVPCVSYNGNEFSAGTNYYDGKLMGDVKVQRGISCEGKPWVFSYERTGVPSCTLTENAETGLAVFAANDTKDSLVSSCSLERGEDGRYEHVIVRPVVEAPYTYENKGVFAPRYDSYITLGPGKSFTAKSHVCVCPPRWRNYAAVSMLKHALKLLDPKLEPQLTDEEVYDLGTKWVRSLFCMTKDGRWLIATNRKQRMFADQHAVRITREEMAERMQWEYWTDIATFNPGFEIGWAGHNFLNSRLLAAKAFATGDKALLEKCIGVYDVFLSFQQPCGLLHTRYSHNYEEDHLEKRPTDACNMGWGAAEAVRMCRLLREHGIDKPELVKFARGICDFFLDHWSDDDGFGKTWHIDGRVSAKGGTIGGFLIPALVELYEETKEQKYLDGALRASDFYYARDIDRFECTAGAIDCYCIDKETAYPFIWGSLALYRLTKDAKHLERAEKAAWYFISWMYFFDAVYGPETDFAQYGYHTTGGTLVSVEHHGIDPWAGIMPPDLFELADLTGDGDYRRIARLMWANAQFGITTRMGQLIHGVQRPIGSQNEAYWPARCNKYRPVVEPGYYNDLLVSWPTSYRLWTLERLRAKGIRMK